MKKFLILGVALAAGSLALQDVTVGHGGSYRGPGDTVPPGGGGGGGGGSGPSSGGPSGPSSGGPSGPSQPGPSTGGPSTGGGGTSRPATGGPGGGQDLTLWEFWWGFNKDPYLNLKAKIHASISTGTDGFWGSSSGDGSKSALKPSETTIRTKVVPELKAALEKERANDIVTGALVALGKIGDVTSEEGVSEFEPIMTKFLKDSSQEIAETAAVALGILANEASVKTLKELALDSPEGRKLVGSTEVKWRTRAFATYGLGLIGAKSNKNEVKQEIARTLVDLLQKPDTSTRDIKVAALISMGLTLVDVDKSEGGDASAGDHGASRQAQIKYLIKFYEDQNNPKLTRAHAPTAMARLVKDCPAELREKVAKLVLDGLDTNSKESDEVKWSCVLALGQIGDSDMDKLDVEIRKTLARVIKEGKENQVRNFVAIAMAQIGGRLGNEDTSEEGAKEARNFLMEQLAEGKTHIKPWAGIGIGVMENARAAANKQGGASAREALRNALKESKSPDEVGAYAIGVGIAGDVEAKSILREKLKTVEDVQPRGYLCVGLGLVGGADSIKDIQQIVRDSKYKPDLIKQAAIGLGLLGDKDLVPEMCKMLEEAKSLASQAAIASALGFIGDSRSIDPLVSMLKRPEITASARGFAAVALGIVADKELLPWNSKISTNTNYRANTTTLTDSEGAGILDIL